MASGNLRELLRYAGTALRTARVHKQQAPLSADFVGAALAAKGYVVGEVDDQDQEDQLLDYLEGREVSASDARLLRRFRVRRSRMSVLFNDLARRRFVTKVTKNRRVLYQLSVKGTWYRTLRSKDLPNLSR